MKMTVRQINEATKIKTGIIENFRKKLQTMGLISNNASLEKQHVELLTRIANAKKENDTWDETMYKFIYEEYWSMLPPSFEWQPEIIVKNMVWNLKNNAYQVYPLFAGDLAESPGFHTYCCIIDNFMYQGRRYEPYKKSIGTDGNTVSYELCNEQGNFKYYIIGKLNHYTGKEDVHIFYNDDMCFNIMKCKYICGGPIDGSFFEELIHTIYERSSDKKNG